MRNLKRAFSLVLALVMALSVVTIAPVAAADETAPATVTSNFTDAAEIKYTEAVAITGGIGLFAGADGKFMPKSTVTRAQMATIIVKMLYGGDANADGFKGNGKFSDTASFEGGWAEGYINWCSTLGVVAGYGDGTFKPGNQVTTAEAATMILNALKIDAGEGTWPNTVMAKAEEEDFFEDLKPMPGTNTALTREELAVIALNGLNWSDSEETGWYVTGGAADQKMTFDSYKDAKTYADKVGGKVQPLEGRDSLANKVYDLKKAEGFITANQATGEKYTELTVDFVADPDVTAWFAVETGANMIGHKVEVWYQETYTSEREPGLTYAVSEAAEYITLNEKVENAKEYKAAFFGTKYDLPAGGVVATSGTGYVTAGQTITGYVANSYAPAGTYVIDLETGNLCGYIAPATVTADVVDYIDTLPDEEAIHLKGLGMLDNTEDGDVVVEYEGIAKDDLLTCTQVQDMYVLTKMDNVAGTLEKYKYDTKTDEHYVTVDGKEYRGFTGTSYIDAGKLNTVANLNERDFGEMFVFYTAPDGTIVGYTEAEGGTVDLSTVVYLVGGITKTECDSYGRYSVNWYARGIDVTGNEVMVLLGTRANTDKNGSGGETAIVWDGELDADSELGVNSEGRFGLVKTGFYTVKDATDPDAKKLGIKGMEAFATDYDPDKPQQTFQTIYTPGYTGTDWEIGGRFEFGVGDRFTGSGGYGGSFTSGSGVAYAYPHKASKFILLEGDPNQDSPLVTSVSTGSVSAYIARRVEIVALVTRQTNGTSSVEVAIIPTSIDHAANAAMVYIPRAWDEATHSWGDAKPSGRTAAGNEYDVYDGTTGAAKSIVVDRDITSITPGFHSISLNAQAGLHQLSGVPVPGTTGASLETQNDRDDGRMSENVAYDVTVNAYSQSTVWLTYADGKQDNSPCSGIKIIDTRTDEQVTSTGVPRITSMDQLWSMMETYSRKASFTLDLCYTSKVVTGYVKVAVKDNNSGSGNTIANGTELPDGIDVVYDTTGNGVTMRNFESKAEDNLITYEISNTGVDGVVLTVTGVYALTAEDQNSALDSLPADVATVIDLRDVEDKITDATGLTEMAVSNAISYNTYTGGGMTVVEILGVTAGVRTTGSGIDATTALNALGSTVVFSNETGDAAYDSVTVADLLGYAATKELDFVVYSFTDKDVVVLYEVANSVYTSVTSGTQITAPGNYKLGADTVTGAINLTTAGEYVLNLNGKTLTNNTAPFITVGEGVILTIKDTGSTGTIQGIEDGTAPMIKVNKSGTLNLEGGTLTGHINTGTVKATQYGGAIGITDNAAGATVNISGGKITGNTAPRGAAISAGNGGNSALIISGGYIGGNTSTSTYGCIYSHTGTFAISGGTVEEVVWWRFGSGTVTGNPVISNLTLADGTTATIGSLKPGASVTTASTLTEEDSTVAKTATGYAYNAGGSDEPVEPEKGTVTANSFKNTKKTVTLEADSVVPGTITLTNGDYTLNLADFDLSFSSGAQIVLGSGATLTINGATGTVTGNSSTKALFRVLTGGKLILASGTLQDHNGDLIEVTADGALQITGGVIDGTVDNQSNEVPGYTVTYKSEGTGVTGMPGDQFKGAGVALTLGAAPERTGYTFKGWSDGTDTYKAGATYEKDADATMTAIWEELTYSVNYDLTNGEGKDGFEFKKQTKYYFTDLELLTKNEPVQTGCKFLGWATEEDGDVVIEPGEAYTYTKNEDLTLYAVWDLAEYPVNLYDGDDLVKTVTKEHGKDLPLPVLADNGNKYFMGWAESSSATTPDYAVGEKFDENGLNNGDTLKLYAVWGTYVSLSGTTTGATSWTASEHYQLSGDWTLADKLTVAEGVDATIDLAGHTIMADLSVTSTYFIVAGGKLTIKDSVGTGKVQFTNTAAKSGGISNRGTFVLEGGELNGWNRNGAGGFIDMYDGATFKMTGGSITGVSATTYSVIRTQGTTGGMTVEITGGKITGNTSGNSIIQLKGTAAAPNYLTISGTANISGNTLNGAAFTEEEIRCEYTHITIGGTATVGALCGRGGAEVEGTDGYPYSSIDITGAPTVSNITSNSTVHTPVTITYLTKGAEIKTKMALGKSQMDSTVARTAEPGADGLYTYSCAD